jgi:hypothetical protein
VLKELIQGYGSVYPPDDDAFGGLLVGTWEGSWTEQGALASHGDVQDNASLGCPRGELVDRVNSTTLQSSRTMTAIVLTEVLQVSMEAWTEDVGDDPPWEQKKDDRMLWRGKNTGIYFKDGVPWGEWSVSFSPSPHRPSWHLPGLGRRCSFMGAAPSLASQDQALPSDTSSRSAYRTVRTIHLVLAISQLELTPR